MFYPITYPQQYAWLAPIGQRVRHWWSALTPAPAHPLPLQPGDTYHLDAGMYRLRVLAGRVWVPEVGIFCAGQAATLTVDAAGLAIHPYARQPAVVVVQGQ